VAALLPEARVDEVPVPEVDWVARFRENFRGFDVGRFRIAPPWDLPAERDASLVVMDPGRAFGTGTHETTRLCVRALEAVAARRPLGRLLDLGTGTGLLAIVGLRLGASLALGTDNDPDATASAVEHARLNDAPLRVVLGDLGQPLQAHSFDVVVANLMAPLLLARRAEIAALLRPGGTLLLSGLLVGDVAEVGPAYACLGPARIETDGEWACLAFDC
jgi:ribosomal protein L11 methyltransferase